MKGIVAIIVFLSLIGGSFAAEGPHRLHRTNHRPIDRSLIPPNLQHVFRERIVSDESHHGRASRGRTSHARYGGKRTASAAGSNGAAVSRVLSPENATCPDSVLLQWDVEYTPDTVSSENMASGIAVDGSGNVYVTGTSDSGFTSTDYVTVKYNLAGVQQWVARYNGPGDDEDIATGIVLDINGNVFVTGTSYDTLSFFDVTTIKYDTYGNRLWVNRYNGPDNDDDGGIAIAMDNTGSPVVTGSSFGNNTFTDIVTIKYVSASGGVDWVRRFNGLANDDDAATAIVTDRNGNIYVTGYSYTLDNGFDIVTIKYFSTGGQDWLQTYDGPEHDEDGSTCIAVDGNGNTYVAGYSSAIGNVIVYDYVTIKYDATGSPVWETRYNGPGNDDDVPGGITANASGNIYVTGRSFGTGSADDVATVKYNSAGVQQWEARYNGPGNNDDGGTAIAVDASGSVFVAAYSYSTGGFFDIATIRYTPGGSREWVMRFNGDGGDDDEPTGLSVDAANNVIVTGSATAAATSDFVFATLKYATQLPCLSLSRSAVLFDTTQVSCRKFENVVVRNGGSASLIVSNVLSTEESFTASPLSATIAAGDSAQFSVGFGPLTTGPHAGQVIFVHNARSGRDSVFVLGSGVIGPSGTAIHTGLGAGWQLISLPVDDPCPYLLGNAFLFDPAHGYVRKDTLVNGRAYWKKLQQPDITFTGYPISRDTMNVLAGWNIIGTVSVPIPVGAIRTIPDSIIVTALYGFNGSSYTVADTIRPGRGYWVKVRLNGSVIVANPVAGERPSTSRDWLSESNVLTITDAGQRTQQLYFRESAMEGRSPDFYELPPQPPEGTFDVRFSSDRMMEIIPEQGGTHILVSGAEYPVTLSWKVKPGMSAFLDAGTTICRLEGEDGIVLTAFPVEGLSLALNPRVVARSPEEFSLAQNYPNPFNPGTVIRYRVAQTGRVSLKVFDVLGREIRTLVDEVQSAGNHSVPMEAGDLAAGLYIYRLTAGGSHAARKMMLLK